MRSAIIGIALAAVLSGCAGSSPQEMLDTAKLEEQQRNVAHARKLYQRILDEHPDSSVAAEARTRLTALGPAKPGS